MIENKTIWNAYRALFRYCQHVGSTKGLSLPKHIPSEPYPLIDETLTHVWVPFFRNLYDDNPICVDEEYFCYLYLFIQMLRCSLPYGVTLVDGKGWKNTAWYPIQSLYGRGDSGVRAWRHWYYQHIQTVKPRPTRPALEKSYPWVPEPGEEEMEAVRRQLPRFEGVSAKGVPLWQILTEYNALGKWMKPGDHTWHPWILVANQECWQTTQVLGIKEVLFYLMEDKERWLVFIEECIPLFNKNQRRLEKLLAQIDNVISYDSPENKKSWRKARRMLVEAR